MDLFLLAMPSILFALLQYKSTIRDSEVKSIQKNMEEYLEKSPVDEKKLRGNKLKKNMDFIRAGTVKSKGVEKKLLFGFAFYLVLIALIYVLDVWGVLGSNNSQGNDYIITLSAWWSSPTSWLSSYMFILVCATCYQIFSTVSKEKEKKKFDEAYFLVVACIESTSLYGKDVPDDL